MAFKVFGIEIGKEDFKIAVLEKRLRSHRIIRLVHRAVEADSPEKTPAMVRRALAELGFDQERDRVMAVFPGEKLTSRNMVIPLEKRSQILEALPFELEASVPFDVEDFVCDYVPIKKVDEGLNIFTVLARNRDMGSFLDVYDSCGLDPDMVIPGPLAIARTLRGDLDDFVEVYIDIASDSMTMTFVKGTAPVFFHVSSVGLDDGSDSIVREIKRQFIVFGSAVVDVNASNAVLIVRSASTALLRGAMEENLGVRVEKAPLHDDGAPVDGGVGFGDIPPREAFASVVGAALMGAELADVPVINLRVRAFQRKPRIAGSRVQTLTAAALMVLLLAVVALSGVYRGIELGGEYDTLKHKTRAEFKKALPSVRNIVSEVQQLKNELNRLKEKSMAIGAGLGEADPFLDYLLDLTRAAPAGGRLDVDHLILEPGRLMLSGRLDTYEQVDQFKQNIAKLGWTGKVNVSNAKADLSGKRINFRLEVDTKS